MRRICSDICSGREAAVGKGRLVRVGTLRGRLILLGIVALMVAFIVTALVYLRKKEEETLAKKKAEQERLVRLIEEEEARTAEIADYRAYIETKSYIEEIAREVLGLVYKDEIIFRPVKEIAPRGTESVVPTGSAGR